MIKRTQHALRLRMDAALAPLDLSTAQYAVLSTLEEADSGGAAALSGAELARRCFVTPQTITGLVSGLLARGMVARIPHPTHGRVVELAMTDDGRDALRRAHATVTAVAERMLAGRTEEERRTLSDWLHACALGLESERADGDPQAGG